MVHSNKRKLYIFTVISIAAMVILYQSNLIKRLISPKPKILFFQHAGLGIITPEKLSGNCYSIHLSDLKAQIIFFANEPARTSGVMNWADFALTWAHNDIYPNAMIHAFKDNKSVNDTVTLSNLHYDKINKTASYKACALDPKTKFAIGQLADVSVFIDPFHPWP
ncbi:MAG: hypothetical protein H0U70_10315 [Tatlockia sp.]|nr:hypothetical protein [Tatlockia sp.]